MHKKIVYLLLVPFALTLMSNKGGRNVATTGAPFESNSFACASCHSGGNFTPVINFVMKDENGLQVEKYEINKSYTLEFQLSASSGNPKSYGFQAVLVDGNNNSVGTILQKGTSVRTLKIDNRDYITQSTSKQDGLFTVVWQAPPVAEALTLYIAGIASNANNGTGGDKAAKANFVLEPEVTSGVNLFESERPKLVCTAGCQELLFTAPIDGYKIFDTHGIRTELYGNHTENIDISLLESGIYIISYVYKGKGYSEKFVR